jgi:hypothetical protein
LKPDPTSDAKLPRIRLFDLRHSHATLLMAAGEHPKVVLWWPTTSRPA